MTVIAERATADVHQIDAFHALLPALARALDVRDVFQHLSAIAARIVPHDEADVALLTDDGSQYRLYASTVHGDPKLLCRDDHCVLQDPIVPRGDGGGRGALRLVTVPLRDVCVRVRHDGSPSNVS